VTYSVVWVIMVMNEVRQLGGIEREGGKMIEK
jgi:hypothetical protein